MGMGDEWVFHRIWGVFVGDIVVSDGLQVRFGNRLFDLSYSAMDVRANSTGLSISNY